MTIFDFFACRAHRAWRSIFGSATQRNCRAFAWTNARWEVNLQWKKCVWVCAP